MIVPDKIVAKQQNFSVVCPGNDATYHSNRYEYDYIKNTLDIATKILCNKINQNKDYTENSCGFRLKSGVYFIMYVNTKNKHNPYFAIYRTKTQSYSTIESVELFSLFKNPLYLQSLIDRIENTLFKDNLLLPGLVEHMSQIANDYDNEIDYD